MRELLDRTVRILGDLVAFPTVTAMPNLALINYASDLLAPLGAELRLTHDEVQAKANLFATIGPPVDGGVVLSGHTDVVPADEPDWTDPPFSATRNGQLIYGRGTADMKGFIACVLAAAPRFAASELRRPLHIALTFDEEEGCRGAPLLLANLVRNGPKPSAAIVGEPTAMQVVTAHKGVHEFTTTFVGQEGHGSQPGLAVNAVEFGARYMAELEAIAAELAREAPASAIFDPPHTTISVGTIRGGSARNVVAGDCVIEWEMRPVTTADAEFVISRLARFEQEMLARMRSVSPSASITTVTEGAVGGLDAGEGSPALALTQDLLGTDATTTVPFGTEAGLYQEAGIPAVVCGPGSIEVAHRPNEHIELGQLERCLVMVEQLRAHLGKE